MGIFRVGVSLGGSCPGGNFADGSFPGWELSGRIHPSRSFHVTNKTDNRTDSYKPRTGRILVQIK